MRRRDRHPLDLGAGVVERAGRAVDRGAHVGLDAVDVGHLLDDADPQPGDAAFERVGERAGAAASIDVESQRVVAPDRFEQQRPRRRPSSRTVRSGRATTRTRSGRTATRVRTSASPRRHRTTPRAGGSSRRCRSRRRAPRTRRRPRPPNRRSTRRAPGRCRAGCGSAPNAEFSVDEPIANSSRLVLPTSTAPAARSRCTTVASYGGRHPSRMRDEHVVGSPRVHEVVLERDRHAGQRTRIVAPRDRGVDLVGRAHARRRRARG